MLSPSLWKHNSLCMLVLSSLALSSILRRETSWRFSSSRRVLTWWLTRSSSLLRRPFWRRTQDITGEKNRLIVRSSCYLWNVNKDTLWVTTKAGRVRNGSRPWCPRCLLSAVSLWSEGLFPKPQSPLWDTCRSTGQCPARGCCKEQVVHKQTESQLKLILWRHYRDHYPVLLLHFLFCFLVAYIAINRHWPDPNSDGQKQQPARFHVHLPSK